MRGGWAQTSKCHGASDTSREAWLFAQAILGKPLSAASVQVSNVNLVREQLEWSAQISPKRVDQIRELQSADAEAHRKRELLIWAAGISTKAEAKLRDLLREEAAAEEASHGHERFYETNRASIAEWNETDHPRRGYGPH